MSTPYPLDYRPHEDARRVRQFTLNGLRLTAGFLWGLSLPAAVAVFALATHQAVLVLPATPALGLAFVIGFTLVVHTGLRAEGAGLIISTFVGGVALLVVFFLWPTSGTWI